MKANMASQEIFAHRAASGIPYVLSLNPCLIIRRYARVQKIPPITINWVNNFYFSKIQIIVDMNFDEGRIDILDSVSYKPNNDH